MKRLPWIGSIPLLAAIMTFSGCSNNEDVPVSKETRIIGLAAPVRLQADSTILELKDYFLDPRKIDSVKMNGSLLFSISRDSTKLIIVPDR